MLQNLESQYNEKQKELEETKDNVTSIQKEHEQTQRQLEDYSKQIGKW